MKKPLLVIIGTRPEAIKLAPVIRRLRGSSSLEPVVCVTGQHRQMLDQALGVFGIASDMDLDVMTQGQDLFDLTADILRGVRSALGQIDPWLTMVQGDTTTAMVSALGSYYMKVPVAHVEAGLRSGDPLNPHPEEINRSIISRVASIHFAPTDTAVRALVSEGIAADAIHLTGNTVIDALLWARDIIEQDDAASPTKIGSELPVDVLSLVTQEARRFILVTGHRRESFGKDLENICYALAKISADLPDVEMVYPVHLNPNVQEPVRWILGHVDRIHLIDPVPYPDFVRLMAKCTIILTDSGGIQEEAPALGKPVLVMRKVTERPEGIEAGCARLVGVETKTIAAEAISLMTDSASRDEMSRAQNPYGDGRAAERIVDVLEREASRR